MKKDKKSEKNEDLVKVILDVSDDTFGISGERVWPAIRVMIFMKSAILLGIHAT